MKSVAFAKLTLLFALFLVASVTVSDARGGRRGGGSIGGIFGGWRKYKKPVSTGNSRRTTNGSPMHTPITTGGNIGGGSSSSSIKSGMQSKTQAIYPRQPLNPGSGYNSLGGAGAHLPPGGAYYANTAAMPPGAIYYAQPPLMRSSSGDFLFGMMAGHVLSHGLYGHRTHVTHVYQQSQQPTANDTSKVIIINNDGKVHAANNVEQGKFTTLPSAKFWPTNTDVPLAPFNANLTSDDALLVPGNDIIFPRVSNNNNNQVNTQDHSNPEAPPPAATQDGLNQAPASTQTLEQPAALPGGIICVPMLFNETDPNDPTKIRNVEKLVCYPAPIAPPPCQTRTITVIDPIDPAKTIEVQQDDCITEQPPQIAGEIGESVGTVAPSMKNRQDEAALPVEQIPEKTLPESLESVEI